MGGDASPQLEGRALEIVEGCLDLDPDARGAYIAAQCQGDPALAARVQHLLDQDKDSFEALSTRMLDARHEAPDPLPDRIGKFRVTGLIGRGGMGNVVRAERDDGLYNQQVAIKLIRGDLRREADRERFATERRLLARLSDPGIARILDGGDQDGRPYLVMELVEGRPVTEDLRARAAGLDETLDVFAAIAEAVSHAHRNLVIHGDLKPSNILRTADGSVKLLDFGIGRMAELDADAGTYPLTPAFSAPERRAGEPPAVSSDVYSLAVLLHEMLCDRLPEGGVPHLGEGSARIPRSRTRDDLEAIVAKGLTSDPLQRYPDVAALQADIKRFRQSRPVSAHPPSTAYTLRLYLRRNRWSVAIGGAFILVLSAATAISLLLFFDAQRQRIAAETRFDELRSLAKFQLFDLYDELAETPGTTAARARLAGEAQRYLDRLSALPQAPADLRLDVARGLDRLAGVLGVPRVPNLGRPDQARANLARAAAILDGLAAETPEEPAVAIEQARNRALRAQIAIWLDFRTDLARPLLAIPVRAGDGSPAAREVEALRRSAWLDMLGWDEDYRAERRAAEDMLRWLDTWPAQRPLEWYLARADALNARGDALYYLDDRAGAIASYRDAEQLMDEAGRRWPRRAAVLARQTMSVYNLVSARADSDPSAALVPPVLDLVRRGEQLIELEPNDVALRSRHLINREMAAQILDGAGRRDEAIEQQRRVVAVRAQLAARNGSEPRALRDLAFSHSVLGTLHWNAGRREAACDAWRVAESGFGRLADAGQLNGFDRERNRPYILRNLDICAGRAPASSYRPPG